MKIMDSTGPKANIIRVPLVDDGSDVLTFKLSKKAMVDLAKDSKTGKSEGLMIALTGAFNYTLDDTKVSVNISQGQGGMGAWTSLKASKVL
jgi:hypothetical protein